jgi:hypothetical protein
MAVAACQNHLDREAIGVCVKCRSRICSECVTKVDGINYCVTCYSRLAGHDRAQRRKRSFVFPRALAPFAAMTWLAFLALFAWGLLEIAFRSG